MLLLEVVEPVVFDAQAPLFLRFVVLCSYLRAVCMVSCRWASGDVARPLLRKNERQEAYTVMGARGAAMKRPAAGRSAAVSESYLPPGASLPPPVLLPAIDLGSVDLHPGSPRTKKSKRKSRVNLGQSEVRKKRMKPAPQSEEALQNAGIVCEENLQPCADQVRGSARARDCTQEPRATQKAVSPCANLLDSEGDTAQLKGSEPCGSDTLSCLRAKLDDLKVRLGGENANTPGPKWVTWGPSLGANRKNQRGTEDPAETAESRRPDIRERYHQDTFAGGRRRRRDSSQGYPTAYKRG